MGGGGGEKLLFVGSFHFDLSFQPALVHSERTEKGDQIDFYYRGSKQYDYVIKAPTDWMASLQLDQRTTKVPFTASPLLLAVYFGPRSSLFRRRVNRWNGGFRTYIKSRGGKA